MGRIDQLIAAHKAGALRGGEAGELIDLLIASREESVAFADATIRSEQARTTEAIERSVARCERMGRLIEAVVLADRQELPKPLADKVAEYLREES